MKKTMNEIFDTASTCAIEELINANPPPRNTKGLDCSKIKNTVLKKCGVKKKSTKIIYTRIAAIAACVCLAVGIVLGINYDPSTVPSEYWGSPAYPPEAVLTPDILGLIIWADETNKDGLDVPAEETDSIPSVKDNASNYEAVEWNGILISKSIAKYIEEGDGKRFLAIKALSINQPTLELDDYIYRGKTYRDICNELNNAEELLEKYIILKDISSSYARLDEDDREYALSKLVENVGQDIAYRHYKDGKFDYDAISEMCSQQESEIIWIEKFKLACERAYISEYKPIPNFTDLKNRMVIEYTDVQVICITIDQFEGFVNELKATFDKNVLNNTLLVLASPNDLGIDNHGFTEQLPVDPDITQVYPDDTQVYVTMVPSTSVNPNPPPDGMIPVPDVIETLVPNIGVESEIE